MIPGFHGFDLIIILVIALLILGPKKLPELGSAIGKSLKEYRKGMDELNAPQDVELKTLSASSKEALEGEHVSANTAPEVVSGVEGGAEHHMSE